MVDVRLNVVLALTDNVGWGDWPKEHLQTTSVVQYVTAVNHARGGPQAELQKHRPDRGPAHVPGA